MNMNGSNPFQVMAEYEYKQWYEKDVSKNLTKEQKKKLLKKLSDYSLEHPIGMAGVKVPLKEFPELSKFSHTGEFSGIQLYVVMKELFKEQHPKAAKQVFGERKTLRLKKVS
jgi:hypothetical protein